MSKRLLNTLALILVLGLVLTGCAAPAAAPAADSEAVAAEEAPGEEGPRDGGTLNIGYSQNPRHMNPLDSVQGVQSQLFRLIYNRLLQYDVGFFGSPPQPSLAESVEVSDDGLTFTFHLRDDVVWHDGEAFTADDVAFTYSAAVHPDNPTYWGPSLSGLAGLQAFSDGEAESIAGIKIIDDYTISMTLEEPSMSFLDTAAFVGILPEHILGEVPIDQLGENEFFSKSPIGTGPFMVTEVVEDQYTRFVRHEDYFLGKPNIAEINLLYPDKATVAAGIETGELDISFTLPTEDVERFIDNPDFKIDFQPSNVFVNITVNTERVPKQIRQAIAHAIDRETLTNELFLEGKLSPPFYHHLGQEFLQPNPYEIDLAYDPDKARELVAAAIADGVWEEGKVMDMLFNGEEPSEEMLFMVQYMQDIGLNTELRGAGDRAAYNQAYLDDRDFDIVLASNAYGPEPDSVNIYYKCGYTQAEGGFNASNFCNERVDQILEEGRAEVDPDKRIALYQELQGILDDELPIIPIRRGVSSWVMTDKLQDATPQYYGHLTNYDGIEKWWLSE